MKCTWSYTRLAIGFLVTLSAASTSSAQLLNSFTVAPTDGPADAGQVIELEIQATSILGLGIPLYLPPAVLQIAADADVSFSNAPSGFSLVDLGNGVATLTAGLLQTFDSDGIITIGVTHTKAEDVEFSVSLLGLPEVGSGIASWLPGPVKSLLLSEQPDTIVAGEPITLVVTSFDEFLNIVTDETHNVEVLLEDNPTGAVLMGETIKATQDGIASWVPEDELTLDVPGEDYTMRIVPDGISLPNVDTLFTTPFAVLAPPEIPEDTDSNGDGGPDDGDEDTGDDDPGPGGDDVEDFPIPDVGDDDEGNTTFFDDSDGDGVADEDENDGPGNGDANGDGILDSLQSNVAVVKAVGEGFIMLTAPDGTAIEGVTVEDSPAEASALAVSFPVGLVRFRINGVASGGIQSTLLMELDADEFAKVDTFFAFGPESVEATPHWFEFMSDGQTGATFQANGISLLLVDGARGDLDLEANETLEFVGGPAAKIQAQGGCGSGACGAGATAAVVFVCVPFFSWKRRTR